MRQAGPSHWFPKEDWEQTVYSMVAPAILFRTEDCIDLPPCQTLLKKVEMEPKQSKAYNELKVMFAAELEDGQIVAVNEGVKRMKLVQIACGAVYDAAGNTHMLPCKSKLELLEQMFYDSGRKLIVYAPFKHVLKFLKEFFEKLKVSVNLISGDVGKGERDKTFYQFQHGDLEVIVAHPAAMAHGITLTAANMIFWWAPVDDNEIYEQANGRIRRIGQERGQTLIQASCSPVEDAIYKRLDVKENMQGLLKELLTTKI